jgi:hypothetical protein
LPGVDDERTNMLQLLGAFATRGAVQVSATYLFLTPFAAVRRDHGPYMREAASQCTEAGPSAGGLVYGPPLPRKVELYAWLQRECTARSLAFGTCGCKDLRLQDNGFSTACSHPHLTECTGHRCLLLFDLAAHLYGRFRPMNVA